MSSSVSSSNGLSSRARCTEGEEEEGGGDVDPDGDEDGDKDGDGERERGLFTMSIGAASSSVQLRRLCERFRSWKAPPWLLCTGASALLRKSIKRRRGENSRNLSR